MALLFLNFRARVVSVRATLTYQVSLMNKLLGKSTNKKHCMSYMHIYFCRRSEKVHAVSLYLGRIGICAVDKSSIQWFAIEKVP
jgi:hypothetical protein